MIAEATALEQLLTWIAIGVATLIALHVVLLVLLTWPTREERQRRRRERQRRRDQMGDTGFDVVPPGSRGGDEGAGP